MSPPCRLCSAAVSSQCSGFQSPVPARYSLICRSDTGSKVFTEVSQPIFAARFGHHGPGAVHGIAKTEWGWYGTVQLLGSGSPAPWITSRHITFR